ncbi:phage tail domain-containing protein [Limosilactobacillus mucosae]|uniref:phage tail domain-containing protein n=1 Tax=Limosilactobacillus mucosae TaxID=97478 RepID=UPI0022DEEDC8|nr:phage tail domain-containing protein [Limosilactobacillus mucosae]
MQKPKLYMKIGDEAEFDIADKVKGLKYLGDDSTLASTNQLLQIPGIDGAVSQYKTYSNYQVPAKFFLRFENWQDYKLAKHQINRLFSSRKLIRIRTDVEPAMVRFVMPNPPEIAPTEAGARYTSFTENFDNPSGYRYSLYRSDSLPNIANGWQFGMNLPKTLPSYHFTSKSFKVYNASDIAIEPYKQKHDLRILFKFSGSQMKITNKTNGSSYTYKNSSNGNDQIILDGIRTTLNGNPASANTDYGTITLETEWNDIDVSGADSVDITFSFPFIYL